MKILIVTDYHNKTGIGSHNYNLYLGLKSKGHDVDIVNLVSKQGYKSNPEYGINIVSNKCNNAMLDFAFGIFYVFKKGLDHHLQTHTYDFVLLGHQGLAYLYTTLYKNCANFGIIVLDLFTLYKNLKANKISNFIYNTFMLKKIDRFQNLVCISNFTLLDYKKFVSKSNDKNIICIHNGFDIDPINLSEKEIDTFKETYGIQGKKIILHVGSEEERKNIGTFLKIAQAYKNNDNFLFVRVGKQSDSSKEFIKDNALHNIKYFSGLSLDILNKFYNIADIYVYTSILEGFGRPLVEAYLHHVVCISSKVSDMDSIFKDSKNVYFVSDPYAVKEYISLIKSHINDSFKEENIDLSLDKEVDSYVNFIKKCIH